MTAAAPGIFDQPPTIDSPSGNDHPGFARQTLDASKGDLR
jgi:hypothetical protein